MDSLMREASSHQGNLQQSDSNKSWAKKKFFNGKQHFPIPNITLRWQNAQSTLLNYTVTAKKHRNISYDFFSHWKKNNKLSIKQTTQLMTSFQVQSFIFPFLQKSLPLYILTFPLFNISKVATLKRTIPTNQQLAELQPMLDWEIDLLLLP